MTPLTAAKLGGGAAAAAGVPASIYLAHNYVTSLYEVENKVLEDSVYFTITDKNETNPLTIKAASSESPNIWSESEGYSWSCKITVSSTLTSVDLSKKIPKDSAATEEIKKENKKKLVYKCSEKREPGANSKKVVANLDFSTITTESELFSALFGPEVSTPAA